MCIMESNVNKTIILDYDNTIVNSNKCVVDVYNKLLQEYNVQNNTNYKLANYKNPTDYNFSNLQYLNELNVTVQDIFEMSLFFDMIEPYEFALETIKNLSEKYELKICTVGSDKNNELKREWIKKYLPFIDLDNNYIHVSMEVDKQYNKSLVDMSNSIFVDDKVDNLKRISNYEKVLSKNAHRIGILFKQPNIRYQWQEGWNGYECFCWEDLEFLIENIQTLSSKTLENL